MIEAIFFDMDGTLIDTEILYAKSLKNVLKEVGVEVSLLEAVDIVYGRSWQGIFETIESLYPQKFENELILQNKTSVVFETFVSEGEYKITSSIELLKELGAKYPLAIVSGSSRVHLEEFIHLLDVQKFVRFYIGSEDCQKSKPSPEGYLKAAEKLNIDPDNCLVFEDSNVGVLAAKSAGMKCVALVREGAPVQDVSMADLTLDDLKNFDQSLLSSW